MPARPDSPPLAPPAQGGVESIAARQLQTADDIIAHLRLTPHPEGGYYRETFRDPVTDAHGRAASTAILFLLKAGQRSRWHRVLDAVEIWHWHAGSPLELGIAAPGGPARRVTLGPDLAAGATPQAVVPAGYWQQACVLPEACNESVPKACNRSAGEFTLVGCTVAPGFLFERFEMAPAGFEPPAA